MWAASFNEDEEMLQLLIDRGAPLEAIAEGETPLLGAVKWSKFRAVDVLLNAGASPDFRDKKGFTALHYMLRKGTDKSHFARFVECGARGDIPGPDGRTVTEIMHRKRDPDFRAPADQLSYR